MKYFFQFIISYLPFTEEIQKLIDNPFQKLPPEFRFAFLLKPKNLL